MEECSLRWARITLAKVVGLVLTSDTVALLRGESLGQYVLMIHVVVLVCPDRANQTQHPRIEGSNLVDEIEVVSSPFLKRKVPPYCCWPKSSWVLWPEIAWRGLWEQNHSYKQPAGGMYFQLRLL